MRKLLPIILSVLLLTVFMIPNAHAEDVKNIEFGEIDTQGYAELDSHTPSYSFQLWHYSGGYWGNETYGIKLMDADVAEGIDTKGIIKYKHPVTIKTDLPAKVKEYLANGGSIDDILIKFELTNGLKSSQIFTGTPTYSINNDQITVLFEPKFAIEPTHLVDHPGMNVHVPIIPEGYGKMVYAMYTPGGKHLGQGGNIEPEDIIDCNGNLREGKQYEYHMAGQPSQYLPGGQIKIGSGTFANGGAVGLEYLFPIKATYYVQQNEAPDFYPTPEGSSEWKPQYKDPKYCAKTYTYEQGQTEITFPVNLFNQGEEAITDFKAVWFNSSKVNPKPWDSSVWEAKEIDRHSNGNNPYIEKPVAHPNAGGTEENPITQPVPGIKLAKGESKTFNVTVPLPVPDYAGDKLVFLCNTNKETPKTETNQENNMMIIKIEQKGIDLAIESEDKIILQAVSGEPVNVKASMASFRNDFSMEPVEAEIKWEGPEGKGSKIKNFVFGDIEPTVVSFTGYAGNTYHVKGEIMPTTETDIDLTNNYCETEIIIVVAAPEIDPNVGKEAPSPDTRVNIIG